MPNEEVKPLKIIDYIDRFAVLEILDKQISFYAEPPVDKRELELLYELRVRIKDIPDIDAIEVVRCKDCKNYKPQAKSAHWNSEKRYCCRCATVKVSDNDFCSYGERK